MLFRKAFIREITYGLKKVTRDLSGVSVECSTRKRPFQNLSLGISQELALTIRKLMTNSKANIGNKAVSLEKDPMHRRLSQQRVVSQMLFQRMSLKIREVNNLYKVKTHNLPPR